MEAAEIYATAIRRAKLAGQTPSVVQFVQPVKKNVEACGKEQIKEFTQTINDLRHRIVGLERLVGRVIHAIRMPLEPPATGEVAIAPEPIKVRPRMFDIKKVVSAHYGYSLEEIEGNIRKAEIVLVRQIAQHLCKRMTLHALPMIGRHFGNRDHTTIMHADRKIGERRARDPVFDAELKAIESKIMASLINDRATSAAPDTDEQFILECKGQGTGENA